MQLLIRVEIVSRQLPGKIYQMIVNLGQGICGNPVSKFYFLESITSVGRFASGNSGRRNPRGQIVRSIGTSEVVHEYTTGAQCVI